MEVNPVNQGNAATLAALINATNPNASPGATSSASGSTKDSVKISQKAKDLSAAKAGKAFTEESTESMSAKLQEASSD